MRLFRKKACSVNDGTEEKVEHAGRDVIYDQEQYRAVAIISGALLDDAGISDVRLAKLVRDDMLRGIELGHVTKCIREVREKRAAAAKEYGCE